MRGSELLLDPDRQRLEWDPAAYLSSRDPALVTAESVSDLSPVPSLSYVPAVSPECSPFPRLFLLPFQCSPSTKDSLFSPVQLCSQFFSSCCVGPGLQVHLSPDGILLLL